MAIKLDNTDVTSISLDSETVKKIILDNSSVWCKPYVFTLTKNTNVNSINLSRSSTSEPSASTGTLLSNSGTATIYYEDAISASAVASSGYHFGNSNDNTTTSYTNNKVDSDLSWSPTVNINNYTLNAIITGGRVEWYNSSSYSTQITTANYNSEVFYKVISDPGHSGDTTGSYILNSTNFTLSGSSATHNFGTLPYITGTYSHGTLPAGIATFICYRKAYDASSYSQFTSGTIYYGDQFYWAATASTGYATPTITYNSSSNYYTWVGNQGDSIEGVTVSGVRTEVLSYTLTISVTNPEYGTYSVNRTSSPYAGAPTGTLNNGDAIYYGDVLTGTATGNGDIWIPEEEPPVFDPPLVPPTYVQGGTKSAPTLTMTNVDSRAPLLFCASALGAYGGWTSRPVAYQESWVVDPSTIKNYMIFVSAVVIYSGYEYTIRKYKDELDGEQYSGTNEVVDNVTATFKFKRTRTTTTSSQIITSEKIKVTWSS